MGPPSPPLPLLPPPPSPSASAAARRSKAPEEERALERTGSGRVAVGGAAEGVAPPSGSAGWDSRGPEGGSGEPEGGLGPAGAPGGASRGQAGRQGGTPEKMDLRWGCQGEAGRAVWRKTVERTLGHGHAGTSRSGGVASAKLVARGTIAQRERLETAHVQAPLVGIDQ